ncbi:MAG: hypothetical protein EB020_07290 [Proteobacteria bacterium]|nr:hypothetical protein [Pseudomonadota bacterium]
MSKQGQHWTWDAVLTGIVPPVISPLTDAGAIDVPALDGLSNHILAEGATGLFILGGCGEGAWLTSGQRLDVVKHSVKVSAGSHRPLQSLHTSLASLGSRTRREIWRISRLFSA